MWACAKKKTHILSLVLCAAIIGSAVTFAIPASAEEPTVGASGVITDDTDDDQPDFTLEDNIEIDGENVEVTLEISYPQLPKIHDNSEEDIQYLNDGNATILRYDNGEISFIGGKFTDYKVTNYEEATDALQAVNTLLNGDDICVMAVRADTAPNGDVYYTFAQLTDNEAHPGVPCAVVPNAFIKVGVDKDGNTISLTSSLDPTKQKEAEYVDQDSSEMTAVLKDTLTTAQQYAEEHGGKVVDTGDEILVDFRLNVSNAVCVIYYIEPDTEDSDIVGYTELFVNIADNQVFDHVPVSEIDYQTWENNDNDVYFDVETEDMEFTDALGNKVTLPVAKNENGYYFISPERKMLVVDSFTTFNTADTSFILDPVEFASAEDAPKRLVTVFSNMIKVYDFYAGNGIKSLDGRGLPLLIGYGYYNGVDRDPEGRDMNNCGYTSVVNGFGCFMFTDSYDLSNCLDITAHEYTHGIRVCTNCHGPYYNNTGAVEESIADILGNLIELQLDPTSDTEKWYIAEASGDPMRSLADPHMFAQPEYIGDINFVMNTRYQTGTSQCDDNGGVHVNNSILPYVVYQMYVNGLSYEQLYDIFRYSLNAYVPMCEYKEVAEIAKFAMSRLDVSEEQIAKADELFENSNLYGDTKSWDNYEKPEGMVSIEVKLENAPTDCLWSCGILKSIQGNKRVVFATSDKNEIAKYYSEPIEDEDCTLTIFMMMSDGGVYTSTVNVGPITSDLSLSKDYNDLEFERLY